MKKILILLLISFLLSGCVRYSNGEPVEDSAENEAQEEAQVEKEEQKEDTTVEIPPKQSEADKAAKLAVEKEAAKETVTETEEPAANLTPVEQVEEIVIDKLGAETNMSKERIVSIEDISDNADGSYFELVLNGNENFTSNLTKRGLQLDAAEILEPMTQISELKKVVIQWFLPLIDVSGNEVDTQVMIINIEKNALDQINWDNFDVGNFEAVSETYFEHAALKE